MILESVRVELLGEIVRKGIPGVKQLEYSQRVNKAKSGKAIEYQAVNSGL